MYRLIVIALLVSSRAFAANAPLSESPSVVSSLASKLSLHAGVHGQQNMPNLDASQGYRASLELRLEMPVVLDLMPGQVQLVGFVDQGAGRLDNMAWSAGSRSRMFASGGVGLNWFHTRRFVVKANYARKLGNDEVMLAPNTNSRFWLNAVKSF